MAISAITIGNFKGIAAPARIELKPITLLFGPNSAGKSTVIQALHYAREIFGRQNLSPDRTLLGGNVIDLGGFESLVHGHDLSKQVSLMFELDLTKEDLPVYDETQYIQEDGNTPGNVNLKLSDVPAKITSLFVDVRIRWSEQLGKPYIESYRVGANKHHLLSIESSSDKKNLSFEISPFNPIFLPEGIAKSDAIESLFNIYESDDDERQHKIGLLCWAWHELTEGFHATEIYSFEIEGGLKSPIAEENAKISFNFPEKNFPKSDLLDSYAKLQIENSKDYHAKFIHNLETLLNCLIVGPCAAIRENLDTLCYIGPIRQVPDRGLKPTSSPDAARWANGLAAYDTLFFSDDAFISNVNDWLAGKDRLNSGYSIDVKKYRELTNDHPLALAVLQGRYLDEEINFRDQLLALPVTRRLVIRDDRTDIELSPHDIGVGISQMIPVVVAALQQTGIIAIEQPELHIHPALQVALGDLFIEKIRRRPGAVFLLETHSEHIMLRLLRRIRETSEGEISGVQCLMPSDLSVNFIEQTSAGVISFPVRVDEDGDFIDRWPSGFFTERAKELF